MDFILVSILCYPLAHIIAILILVLIIIPLMIRLAPIMIRSTDIMIRGIILLTGMIPGVITEVTDIVTIGVIIIP